VYPYLGEIELPLQALHADVFSESFLALLARTDIFKNP